MRSLLLLLVVASVAAFKPECSKPTLLTLRGGGIDNGGGNAAYRRPGHTYRAQGSAPAQGGTSFLSDLSNEQDQMSDAERVYVVQQFSQQTVQKAFLKRVYAILSAQLAVTTHVESIQARARCGRLPSAPEHTSGCLRPCDTLEPCVSRTVAPPQVTMGLAITIRGNRPLLILLIRQQWLL